MENITYQTVIIKSKKTDFMKYLTNLNLLERTSMKGNGGYYFVEINLTGLPDISSIWQNLSQTQPSFL